MKWLSVVGLALTLACLLWGAAAAWTHLIDRVTALEREQRYLHGVVRVPEAQE